MASSTKITIDALYEGTFSVGTDKQFRPVERDESAEKGALKISINPFLIRTPERNILFDAGIGDFGEDTSTDIMRENLSKNGLSEYDITDIFLSHLHYDHIGGLAGKSHNYWELTFPESKIWVSEGGWKKVTALGTYYDDEKTEFIHFLDARADLHFLDEEAHPYPEITVRKIGGHTEFSQLLLFESGKHKYMMAGDVLAARGKVNQKFAAKFDYDPERSMKLREELTRKAYEEQFLILGYHDSEHPIFRLTDYEERRGYSIQSPEEHART